MEQIRALFETETKIEDVLGNNALKEGGPKIGLIILQDTVFDSGAAYFLFQADRRKPQRASPSHI